MKRHRPSFCPTRGCRSAGSPASSTALTIAETTQTTTVISTTHRASGNRAFPAIQEEPGREASSEPCAVPDHSARSLLTTDHVTSSAPIGLAYNFRVTEVAARTKSFARPCHRTCQDSTPSPQDHPRRVSQACVPASSSASCDPSLTTLRQKHTHTLPEHLATNSPPPMAQRKADLSQPILETPNTLPKDPVGPPFS